MSSTLIQMTLIILCGAGWRLIKPGNLSAEQTRLILTTTVYYLFLPAMILEVLWTTDRKSLSLNYSILGISCVLLTMLCAWSISYLLKFEHRKFGAILLAAAFPNVTYLGLPILEQTFGNWAKSIVIQTDLFAVTPVLFTLGAYSAQYYGETGSTRQKPLMFFFNTPPFLAAILGVTFNNQEIIPPDWLLGTLRNLSMAVTPLMLFSLGLALHWRAISLRNMFSVIPAIIIKLILMPLIAITIANILQIPTPYKAAAVLDLSMPSMVLGIVFCDRYRLDSALYATAVTITTLLSVISLPFWYKILTNTYPIAIIGLGLNTYP